MSETKIVDKIDCDCGKKISKKNLTAHLKTGLHVKVADALKTLPPPEPKITGPVSLPTEPQKNDGGTFKIKQRFDTLDIKLDLVLDKLDEVLDELYGSDDEEEEQVNLAKSQK